MAPTAIEPALGNAPMVSARAQNQPAVGTKHSNSRIGSSELHEQKRYSGTESSNDQIVTESAS